MREKTAISIWLVRQITRWIPDKKMQLIAELASAIGRPIDLVDFAMIGEPLLGQIIVDGQGILGDDAHYARLVSTHPFAEADFVPYQTRILQERRQLWIGH